VSVLLFSRLRLSLARPTARFDMRNNDPMQQSKAQAAAPTNGKSHHHAGETVSYDPATLEEIGRVPNTDLEGMPEISARARAAQKRWAALSFAQRKTHVLRMRDYIVEHAEDLAAIVSRDNGKSRIDAMTTEVLPSALAADWYASNAAELLAPKKLPMGSILFANKRNELHRVPLGVVGIISPWNYPLSIPFGEVVMGLMAGNAILLKVAGTDDSRMSG
jgi:succinate-semialdehyde dehydrogenase/glutarate-semialdehyde dehydrogenase